MIRKMVLLALLSALFIIASCDDGGGGNNGTGGKDGGCAITAFGFTSVNNSGLPGDVTGTISGTSIAATVPYGTAVTALKATFTTTGTSVTVGSTAQESGVTSNDFSSTVTYTVTAADGSTQDYTVTVTIAVNTAKEITAFGFTSANNSVLSTNVTGAISGTDISVTVPYGTTSIANLVATFTTTGTSVKIGTTEQTSGTTVNDFSSAKTYTVTAADGSMRDYTVTVTIASNSAKEITAFSFPGITWDSHLYTGNHNNGNDLGTTISGTSITAKLPYGSTSMAATFATSGASVTVGGVTQTSGVTSNDFKSPVTYRVTAADSSWQDYTVTVLFVPAVGSMFVTGNSSYWVASASTSTDAVEMSLGLTCDAINAGSDTFTMVVWATLGGTLTPHAPGSVSGPYLTVPSDTTVTPAADNDYYYLQIVGPLNSIKSVISQLQYVPPAFATEDMIYIELTDKNGLRAFGRIYVSVSAP